VTIILGFGSTEEKTRHDIRAALLELNSDGDRNNFIQNWNKDIDRYDELPGETAPERYTRIFYYDNQLCFHHINRRHPFSPDGWAALIIREPLIPDNEKSKEDGGGQHVTEIPAEKVSDHE